jgi:beta-mannosidase
MTPILDLSTLAWTLTGWRPFAWKLRRSVETGGFLAPDHGPYPARLPGSVQESLRRAGALPDWHVGRNSLAIEWVEHRHWMFSAWLPALEPRGAVEFHADSLDYSGWILLDGAIVGEFCGALRPVRMLLGHGDDCANRELAIVFAQAPAGQGQLGWTSRARELRPRYNFGWDWCPRVVPSGAAGALRLEAPDGIRLEGLKVAATVTDDLFAGQVRVDWQATGAAADLILRTVLRRGETTVAAATTPVGAGPLSVRLSCPRPELWWPNGEGPQPLYELDLTLVQGGAVVGNWHRTVGFKHVAWRPCAGAPPGALPWLCVVNGRPVFLQGVNWTPVRLCYQDTTREEVERLVGIYGDLGCNLLRVWGGGYLESPEFYAACDRAGLLVWQEFPLSSSGQDSRPPEDAAFLAELADVARHYIRSRQHHVCLLQWCGGNEQCESAADGRRPLDASHPALAALARVVAEEDPNHRFLPTSPFGPRFHSAREEFGRGVHHEVHGPWGLDGHPGDEWERYWRDDDALFRGEAGVAGASRVELVRRYAGGDAVWPPDTALWRHASGWWAQWERLGAAFAGADPGTAFARYVEFTRREQAEKLAFAVRAKKAQFPRCGGFLIWMGHDSFPCLANTSIVEFDHALKPAAHAVAAVFRATPESLA